MAGPAILSCLLVEDEALIGMGLEDLLSDIGLQVAGPFASCADALHWLGCNEQPTFAVLDFTLRDGPCTELALTLIRQGVPLVIYSGHSQEQPETPPELRDVRWIEKPVAESDLMEALIDLVPSLAHRFTRRTA